jgi:hypothetical protein
VNAKLAQVLALKAEAAENLKYNNRCVHCGEKIVFVPDTKGRARGHVYSEAGKRDVSIIKMCEYCFDDIAAEPVEPPEDAVHPFPGNVMMQIDLKDSYADADDRIPTTDLSKATVVTSLVESQPTNDRSGGVVHRPVIDMDFPVKVIESSTPGHSHLYIDREIEWDDYVKLLEVMAEIGLVEPGYVSASKDRGFTALRLPWVKKHPSDVNKWEGDK